MAGENTHPPIHLISPHESTVQEDFADRAYEILVAHGTPVGIITDDSEVMYPVTRRVDLISTDDALEVALRLIRHPAFAMSSPDEPDLEAGTTLRVSKPSDEFIVMGLQYGSLVEEDMADDEPILDQDFTWRPYVTVVVPAEEGDVSMFWAENGEELDESDVIHAQVLMEMMARELSGIACERALNGEIDRVPVLHESLESRFEELPVGEMLDLNFECPGCGVINAICNCPNPKMN